MTEEVREATLEEKHDRASKRMVAHGLLDSPCKPSCSECKKLTDLESGLEYTGMIISRKNDTITELAYILKRLAAKHSDEGALFYLRNTMDKDDCLLLHTND